MTAPSTVHFEALVRYRGGAATHLAGITFNEIVALQAIGECHFHAGKSGHVVTLAELTALGSFQALDGARWHITNAELAALVRRFQRARKDVP